jgi:hypothetical protein
VDFLSLFLWENKKVGANKSSNLILHEHILKFFLWKIKGFEVKFSFAVCLKNKKEYFSLFFFYLPWICIPNSCFFSKIQFSDLVQNPFNEILLPEKYQRMQTCRHSVYQVSRNVKENATLICIFYFNFTNHQFLHPLSLFRF